MKLGNIQKHLKLGAFIILLFGGLLVSIFAGSKVSNMFLNSAKADQCPAQNIQVSKDSIKTNSSIISWTTSEKTSGKVIYGVKSSDLSVTLLEEGSEKSHTMPLTLLTPGTKYFYLISIGGKMCDSSGQTCDYEKNKSDCVPWTFTTQEISPQGEIVAPIESVTPYVSVAPTLVKSASPSATSKPEPTSGMSVFCKHLKDEIGETNDEKNATKWATVKQYDLDNNGIINGKDIIKCPESGK